MKKSQSKKLESTGERLIPEKNKGAAFFYEHLARYLFASQFVKNQIVLDAGCGSGYGSFILAKYGKAKKVYSTDISQEAIDYAQSKYFHKNIIFQTDDVEKLKTISAKSVDAIVSFEIIEHLKNQEKFLDQVKRTLKKDGLFIVSTPNKYNYPEGNPFHTKELYPKEFYQLLKKYFKKVKFYHQGFEFTQLIKPGKDGEKFSLEETFNFRKIHTYTTPINPKTSQYIIALCSDGKLLQPELVSLTSQKVDSFDLTTGMVSLGKQFNNLQTQNQNLADQLSQKSQEAENYKNQLHKEQKKLEQLKSLTKENQNLQNQIEQTRVHIQNLENTLNMIKSAKFFRLWQQYCKIRDKILKHE